MTINIVIKHESCDNLLKNTIKFLKAIKQCKNKLNQKINVQVMKDDKLNDHYLMVGNNVLWGSDQIMMFLMKLLQQNTQSEQVQNRQYTQPKKNYQIGDEMGGYNIKIKQQSQGNDLVQKYLQGQASNKNDQEKKENVDDFKSGFSKYDQMRGVKPQKNTVQNDLNNMIQQVQQVQQVQQPAQQNFVEQAPSKQASQLQQKKQLIDYQKRLLEEGD